MSWEHVPGYVSERESFGETTVTVEREQLREAALHMRDEEGFNMLSDVSPADYLGWGEAGVAGYWGSAARPRHERAGLLGAREDPGREARRASPSRTTCSPFRGPTASACRCGATDGEPVPSVVSVWPTADWHEREAYDLMGIAFEGHPNLVRILMEDDWEGHPLRKDYPIGGEPVRFSEAE